jgi:L-rhamnose-H+ transport protein
VSQAQSVGIAIVMLGGCCQGVFMLPMKWAKKWEFENTWLIFSFFAYLAFPWLIVSFSTPQYRRVLAATDTGTLVIVALLGVGWALAALTFGIGIDAVGLSLGFAIIFGLATFSGVLIPLVTTPGISWGRTILAIVFLVVMLVGVAACSFAGRWREQSADPGPKAKLSYGKGISLCVISGLLGAFGNFGFAVGARIASVAEGIGVSASGSTSIVWAYLCVFMFLFNAGYSLFLLHRNSSTKKFAQESGKYASYSMLMGALWIASFFLYGIGVQKLGRQGVSLGWGIFMCTVVLIANCCGVLTGEWRGAPRSAKRQLAAGLIILVVAIIGLSVSNAI